MSQPNHPPIPAFPPITPPPTPTSRVKRLYLIRHGETAPNQQGILQGAGIDEYLNDRGVRQAECLRDRMADVHVDVIISSRLNRARQTAEIVAQKHPNTPFLEVEELAEIHWGDWDGKRAPQLKKLLAKWAEGDYEAKSPNGESPLEVEQRAVPAIYNLLNRPEEVFLIVVHGRLLRIILSSLIYASLQHMQSFTHHNTTVNVVDAIVESSPSPPSSSLHFSPQDGENVAKSCRDRPDWKGDDSFVPDGEGAPRGPPVISTDRGIVVDSDPVNGGGVESPLTSIPHPEHVRFLPVVLDSYEHLPEELVLD
ncbi:hypothetical protein HDV00_002694 [Rhizophlyctis rosea]|nr:hypothetical protein HDV00_002694 [Rhizophlyctis rosea]